MKGYKMSQKNKKCTTSIGGQAVMEGVMMRGSKGLATAVRTPSGKIEVDMKNIKTKENATIVVKDASKITLDEIENLSLELIAFEIDITNGKFHKN